MPDGVEGLHKKLDSATRHIHANMAAFSAKELEEMVREKLFLTRERCLPISGLTL